MIAVVGFTNYDCLHIPWRPKAVPPYPDHTELAEVWGYEWHSY